MVPALSAAPASTAPQRLGFVYVPNGMFLPNFHPAGPGGTAYELTPILQPLEALRSQVVVVSGLSNMPVLANDQGGGVHTRNHAGWLSGVLPKRTEGANITSAKTVDQYAADKLGADTPLRSLELTLESNYQVGNCEAGYSCAYLELHLVARAQCAAAARGRSPGGLPAAVRRRRFRLGAHGADAEGPQHPRLGHGERGQPEEAARRV